MINFIWKLLATPFLSQYPLWLRIRELGNASLSHHSPQTPGKIDEKFSKK